MSDLPPPLGPLLSRQLKSRKARNLAIAVMIALLVVLVYVLTIAKLGGHVAERSM